MRWDWECQVQDDTVVTGTKSEGERSRHALAEACVNRLRLKTSSPHQESVSMCLNPIIMDEALVFG